MHFPFIEKQFFLKQYILTTMSLLYTPPSPTTSLLTARLPRKAITTQHKKVKYFKIKQTHHTEFEQNKPI